MYDFKNVDGMLEMTQMVEQKQLFTREQIEDVLNNNFAQIDLLKMRLAEAEASVTSVKAMLAQADTLGVTLEKKAEEAIPSDVSVAENI